MHGRDRPVTDVADDSEFWDLILYAAGQSPKSLHAFANLDKLCREHLAGRYAIEIVDVLEHPDRARDDDVLAIPTLVRRLPGSLRKIIGDLSDTARVLHWSSTSLPGRSAVGELAPTTVDDPIARPDGGCCELTLFVSGASDLSARAITNARKLCDLHIEGRTRLTVVDVRRDPEAARGLNVLATPTLVRTQPLPVRRIVGDLSAVPQVLHALQVRDAAAESERQSRRDHLNQSQRLESLGQLAGGVAHDFNNLLALILNYAAFVAEETNGSVRDDVEQIRTAAESAARLTHQLLIFGRRERAQPEQLDLNVMVEEVRELLSRSIGKHIQLLVRTQPSLPAIRADRGQIDQVLLNLAVNARDAMPEGGTLVVATRSIDLDENDACLRDDMQPGRYVELSVKDTGLGMSPEVVSHVFEPFYTTKPPGQGTGLGLATVYGIVSEAGGSIAIQSDVGVGTTILVYLRAEADTDTQVLSGTNVAPKGRGETILVVEDVPAMLAVATRLLERNGYQVLQAASGDEAIGIAAHHDFQLLLTDSVMPKMSGFVLTEKLRATRPELRVLFMSGYSDAGGPQGPSDSLAALIQKPFTEYDLLVEVDAALDRSSRRPREGAA